MAQVEIHSLISELLPVVKAVTLKSQGPDPETTHETRVAIKRLRARLRFVKSRHGTSSDYKELDKNLHALGHALSTVRDRDVLGQTLQKLALRYATPSDQDAIAYLKERLIKEPQKEEIDLNLLRVLYQHIEISSKFTKGIRMHHEALTKVFQKSWAKMCKCGRRALAQREAETLHEWRKQVKLLQYQWEVAGERVPHSRKQYRRVKRLGERLGQIHDLFVLQDYINSIQSEQEGVVDIYFLHDAIVLEISRLIGKCHKLYAHFCES